MTRLTVPILIATLFAASFSQAATGDRWVDRQATFPWEAGKTVISRDAFATLKAEVIIGKLNIFWRSSGGADGLTATLHFSPDFPGHWSARDWRSLEMRKRGDLFDAKVPVTDIDVPVVYYVSLVRGGQTSISSPRVLYPRSLGMEKPSTLFWPFLEGFEIDGRNWDSINEITVSESDAHNGRRSLRVLIPPDKRSAFVHTTRVRGWYFRQRNATGLKIWLKASKPGTKVRFKLTSNYASDRTEVTPSSRVAVIGPRWEAVELPLDSFRVTTPGDIDLFSLEFVNDGPVEVHLDDLELTGTWRISRRY